MKRYLLKLTWMLAFFLGLFIVVYGVSKTTPKETCDDNSSEKCTDGKIGGSSISIKSISRHFLDFSK